MLFLKLEVFVEASLLRQQPFAEAVGHGERREGEANKLRVAIDSHGGLRGREQRPFDTNADPAVSRPVEQTPFARARLLEGEAGIA